MRLLLLFCLCALAAAHPPPAGEPTSAQLSVSLDYLFRRFLHTVAPEHLELQDALGITYRHGMMSSPPFVSERKATFDGVEANTFSEIHSVIGAGQKGVTDKDTWVKQDGSDVIVTYHHGGSAKFHMVSSSGVYKAAVLGNPLYHKHADVVVVVPKSTFFTQESLSEEDATFISYLSVPAWSEEHKKSLTADQMAARFPEHADLIHSLAKPGTHSEHLDGGHDHGHHNDDDHHHHDHDHDHDHGHESAHEKRPWRRAGSHGRHHH